jgi:hypothetical protein
MYYSSTAGDIVTRAFVERRSNERFQLKVPAFIQHDREIEEKDARALVTRDICSGGAYFQTKDPLPVGTRVKIKMILPLEGFKLESCIKVSGTVLRATKGGMAICFDDDYVITPWLRTETISKARKMR